MFEDEEAIPTDEAPTAPGLESGAPQEQASPGVESAGVGDGTPAFEGGVPMPKERPQRTGAVQDVMNIANEGGVGPEGPIKRIISYLMGADAAPLPEVEQRSRAVDQSGRMPASARNVLSVAQAAAEDPEAAWRLVQGHRTAFNAKQAYAYSALNGNPNKRPDMEAAIDAANKAQAHVLDGSEIRFAANPRGVTATVMSPDGPPKVIPMTVDQFRSYLNVGGEGQFDKLMDTGVPAAIQKIATGQVSRLSQLKPMQPKGAQPAPQQQEAIATGIGDEQVSAPEPKSQATTPPTERGPGYSRELEDRAQRIFPWASQSQQREAWLAQQSAREADNNTRVQVAREGATSRVDAAEARAQGGVQTQRLKNEGGIAVQQVKNEGWKYASDAKKAAAEAKAEADLKKLESQNANAAQTRALRYTLEKVRSLQDLKPEEQQLMDRYLSDAGQSANVTRPQAQRQQPAPQAQQAQQASPGQPPEKGAKFYQGRWYRRGPSGEAQLIQ